MNKTASIVVGIIIVIAIGGAVFWQQSGRILETSPSPTASPVITSSATPAPSQEVVQEGDAVVEPTVAPTTEAAASATPTAEATPSGITAAMVSQHNSRSSCWSSINGSVYDLTSWIPNHPGGEQRILNICGIDGSAMFNAQHGRSNKVATVLAGFKIGALAQ